jgi:UDP-2,3-diacylglucosamine pyrophosphatase LpxH
MPKKDEQAYTIESLDKARSEALKASFDVVNDRVVVLSDVHKGDRQKGSDDFQHNEAIYCCALDYYLKRDFKLVLAGDIEEGWECKYQDIMTSYKDTAFQMEKRFVEKEKTSDIPYYFRIFGNHDGDWAKPEMVERHLWPVLGQISVYPALFLGDKIFIVHGHQGDPNSDRGAKLSRSVVRYIWKPLQNVFRFMNTSAAKNNKIRRKRDQFLFEWAQSNSLMLIAGHTHRGMFESFSKTDQLQRKKSELETKLAAAADPPTRLLLQVSLEKINEIIKESKEELEGDKQTPRLGPSPPPCYFNDGSCVHPDGITGIEIDRGRIRLVKWELSDTTCPKEGDGQLRAQNLVSAERKIYQTGNLAEILERIQSQT